MGIAKVTSNFQVTIPRDIRRIHHIEVGDTVLFAIEGNRVDFMKMERDKLIDEIAGSWKCEIKGSSVDYVRNIRAGWKKRSKRIGL